MTVLALELLQDVLNEVDVKVFTTQVCVTVGGLHFKHTLLHLQNRYIEGTTTQVIHGNDTGVRTIKAIR